MIATSQVTIGNDTPIALTTPGADNVAGQRFIFIPDAATVYIGDDTVTPTTGFPVAATGIFDTELEGGEAVYGICNGTDTTTASLFQSGV